MRVRFVIAATIATALAACGDASTGTNKPANKTVDIVTNGDIFDPTFQTLNAGDTARWNFAGGSDGQGHNVRFSPRIAGAPADINVFKTGTQTRVFTTKGTFKYECDVHPGMRAEITVK